MTMLFAHFAACTDSVVTGSASGPAEPAIAFDTHSLAALAHDVSVAENAARQCATAITRQTADGSHVCAMLDHVVLWHWHRCPSRACDGHRHFARAQGVLGADLRFFTPRSRFELASLQTNPAFVANTTASSVRVHPSILIASAIRPSTPL